MCALDHETQWVMWCGAIYDAGRLVNTTESLEFLMVLRMMFLSRLIDQRWQLYRGRCDFGRRRTDPADRDDPTSIIISNSPSSSRQPCPRCSQSYTAQHASHWQHCDVLECFHVAESHWHIAWQRTGRLFLEDLLPATRWTCHSGQAA